MRSKHLVTGVFVAIIVVGGFLYGTNSRLFSVHQDNEAETVYEPGIGAAHDRYNQISVTRKESLNFGALVGGHSNRYVELSPDGELHTSGPIVDQSKHTYIGDVNSWQFVGARYQVRPGRLTLKVNSAEIGKYVLVKFHTGELDSGVTLSRLDLRTGPETNGVQLIRSHRRSNELMFKIVNNSGWRKKSSSNVAIDLLYGGRLTLAGNLSSEVNVHMEVKVTIGSDMKSAYN